MLRYLAWGAKAQLNSPRWRLSHKALFRTEEGQEEVPLKAHSSFAEGLISKNHKPQPPPMSQSHKIVSHFLQQRSPTFPALWTNGSGSSGGQRVWFCTRAPQLHKCRFVCLCACMPPAWPIFKQAATQHQAAAWWGWGPLLYKNIFYRYQQKLRNICPCT